MMHKQNKIYGTNYEYKVLPFAKIGDFKPLVFHRLFVRRHTYISVNHFFVVKF